MKRLSKNKRRLAMAFQYIAALILIKAVYLKFSGNTGSMYVFETLGIPETRLFIATLEGLAVILLLHNSFAHLGALLGFTVMIGALIAHTTVLGLEVQNDRGQLVFLMVMVMISTSIVMWIRRRRLPFIGGTLD